MRYQPFRCNCNYTTINADPLSSSFSKSNVANQTLQISEPQVKHGYTNMPVSTYTRGHPQVKTKTHGIFPRFPQVKLGNTNKLQEQTSKTRIGQKIACTAARIMASHTPPMIFDSSTRRDSTQYHSHYPVLILESSQIKQYQIHTQNK